MPYTKRKTNRMFEKLTKEDLKKIERMEKTYPDHFNQPQIKPTDHPNEFVKVEDSDSQHETKEVATKFKPILTYKEMRRIEKGAIESAKNELKIRDALNGKPPEEIGRHPYYDFNKIK